MHTLVLSKMVVTLLVGIAPVMITLTLFKITQDYFNRWLSALIAWSLYPIVIAGVLLPAADREARRLRLQPSRAK
ncbi:MAG: type IV secretion system protein [Sulfitobacter sp.]